MENRIRALAAFLAVCAFEFVVPEPALAADFTIKLGQAIFEGRKVGPGDTVTMEAGIRGPLRIENLEGTASSPIVLRNDPEGNGPVILRNPRAERGAFVFNCIDCSYVVIDGTQKWNGAPGNAYCGAPDGTDGCGIQVTSTEKGDAPTVYFMISGLSSHFTLKGVEVNGNFPAISRGGIGIRLGDQEIKESEYPNKWREEIVFEQNYVHDIDAEGFYIGPNWVTDQLRLRNVKIRQNLVRKTGWEGIQLKSAIAGENEISGNVVIGGGAAKKDNSNGAHIAIQPYESVCDVFDNVVIDSGESGIGFSTQYLPAKYGPLDVRIYNNVVANTGTTGPLRSHGITVFAHGARHAAKVYNNTIVDSETHGINIDGENIGNEQFVANNLITDVGDKGVHAPNGTDEYSNTVDATGAAGFVDAGASDYRLAADSAARDTGSTRAVPSTDLLGIPRPQGAGPDRGAYEFMSEAPPRPPVLL